MFSFLLYDFQITANLGFLFNPLHLWFQTVALAKTAKAKVGILQIIKFSETALLKLIYIHAPH
jgi:hypothetical protein